MSLVSKVVLPLAVTTAVSFGTYKITSDPPKPIKPIVEFVTGKTGDNWKRNLFYLGLGFTPYLLMRGPVRALSEEMGQEMAMGALKEATSKEEALKIAKKAYPILTFKETFREELFYRVIPSLVLPPQTHIPLTSTLYGYARYFREYLVIGQWFLYLNQPMALVQGAANAFRGVLFASIYFNQGFVQALIAHTLYRMASSLPMFLEAFKRIKNANPSHINNEISKDSDHTEGSWEYM